jgi:GNAT superfamily N-acetyltransferase
MDKDLSQVLIDFGESKDKHIRLHPRVIGGLWVNQNSSYFSFDIVIDKHYHNKGLSDKLINAAIDEYEDNKEIYGDDFKMEVKVINPKLKEILENKYNFKVIQKIGPNTFLMTIDD